MLCPTLADWTAWKECQSVDTNSHRSCCCVSGQAMVDSSLNDDRPHSLLQAPHLKKRELSLKSISVTNTPICAGRLGDSVSAGACHEMIARPWPRQSTKIEICDGVVKSWEENSSIQFPGMLRGVQRKLLVRFPGNSYVEGVLSWQ